MTAAYAPLAKQTTPLLDDDNKADADLKNI